MGFTGYLGRRAAVAGAELVFAVAVGYVVFHGLPMLISCSPSDSDLRCVERMLPLLGTGPPCSPMGCHIDWAGPISDYSRFFGLGLPVYIRFPSYVWNTLTFNFGNTVTGSQTILQIMSHALPFTVLLVATSAAAALASALLLVRASGSRAGGRVDLALRGGSLLVSRIPVFIVAALIGMAPVLIAGNYYVGEAAATYGTSGIGYATGLLGSLSLPFFTLTLVTFAWMYPVFSASLARRRSGRGPPGRDAGQADRGLAPEGRAPLSAAAPVLGSSAYLMGLVTASVIVIEVVYGWPGLGFVLFLRGIEGSDLPLMSAAYFLLALLLISGSFAIDVAEAFLSARHAGVRRSERRASCPHKS